MIVHHRIPSILLVDFPKGLAVATDTPWSGETTYGNGSYPRKAHEHKDQLNNYNYDSLPYDIAQVSRVMGQISQPTEALI